MGKRKRCYKIGLLAEDGIYLRRYLSKSEAALIRRLAGEFDQASGGAPGYGSLSIALVEQETGEL